MTGAKSCVNSGPFRLLFWMTSLARYRKVSLRDTLAADEAVESMRCRKKAKRHLLDHQSEKAALQPTPCDFQLGSSLMSYN